MFSNLPCMWFRDVPYGRNIFVRENFCELHRSKFLGEKICNLLKAQLTTPKILTFRRENLCERPPIREICKNSLPRKMSRYTVVSHWRGQLIKEAHVHELWRNVPLALIWLHSWLIAWAMWPLKVNGCQCLYVLACVFKLFIQHMIYTSVWHPMLYLVTTCNNPRS